VKIVSLLPSATEIVYALGLGNDLVGISCDCDYPAEATAKPVISHSALRVDATTSPAEIDQQVRESVAAAEPIYGVDRDLIAELQPDLILAQDLCKVCAVPSGHVTEALDKLGCSADVISLDPNTLEDVLRGIETVADATRAREKGGELVKSLRARVDAVRAAAGHLTPVPMFALEWADPPFTGGHWVPEMVQLAGGREVLGIAGAPSRECTWDEIATAAPQVIVFMPCGYGLHEALDQAGALCEVPQFAVTPAAQNGQVWVVDSSSYFSRPGPRLVDGLEIVSWILHPDVFPEPPVGRVKRVA